MWLTLMQFIGGPVISGLISAYQAKLKSETTDIKIASDLAATEITAQTAEMNAQTQLKLAQVGHPFEPERLGFYIALSYFAKCVIWDTMLGLGTTPPLHGDISIWCGLIISYYYAKRTFQNVAAIIRR